ncbi:hypothetical protein [Planosporangium thailandense]|uniref:hypothetical protein n=1 Tax=Planosporangium thailandense TaxID=765197 RepID=UPI001F11209A|nr:hypothetical protein [Planosporangium thailandense]
MSARAIRPNPLAYTPGRRAALRWRATGCRACDARPERAVEARVDFAAAVRADDPRVEVLARRFV